jgi:hypothetical protein
MWVYISAPHMSSWNVTELVKDKSKFTLSLRRKFSYTIRIKAKEKLLVNKFISGFRT